MNTVRDLPAGYSLTRFLEIDSTNKEALRQANSGAPSRLWILADVQTAGRGRLGRVWVSEKGNFFASLLLRLTCHQNTATQLTQVAAVSIHDCLSGLIGPNRADLELRLKWPNDLLLNGRKLSGILLESSVTGAEKELAVAIGIGINLTSHPDATATPSTHLSEHGINVTPQEVLTELAYRFEEWLQVWGRGTDFHLIREAWLKRAGGLGEEIKVRIGEEVVTGTFTGIDEDGALIIKRSDGRKEKITVGDVTLRQENTGPTELL